MNYYLFYLGLFIRLAAHEPHATAINAATGKAKAATKMLKRVTATFGQWAKLAVCGFYFFNSCA